MHRKTCLLHANCQGEGLAILLNTSFAFSDTYRIIHKVNYIGEPISHSELSGCGLFLYQYLDEKKWGPLSSHALLGKLPEKTPSLQIPNLMFKPYWPFWTGTSTVPAFGDWLLDRLIDEGASKAVILRIYLHGNIQAYVNLHEQFEKTIAYEREKERNSCVQTVDFTLASWKKKRMFHTVNHPNRDLLVFIAQGILSALGMPPLTEKEIAGAVWKDTFAYYDAIDLPVHPQVAEFHGLEFLGPEAEFMVYGRPMTFAQYVSRYIDCRLNGLDDTFIQYLQVV